MLSLLVWGEAWGRLRWLCKEHLEEAGIGWFSTEVRVCEPFWIHCGLLILLIVEFFLHFDRTSHGIIWSISYLWMIVCLYQLVYVMMHTEVLIHYAECAGRLTYACSLCCSVQYAYSSFLLPCTMCCVCVFLFFFLELYQCVLCVDMFILL